ncbi:MAG: metallophosphoesterase [Eubacterium sp.]|nr:metallophosphoesterase [Eubacterium sp.]
MNILHLSDIHFGRNYPEYGLKEPFERHDEILDGIIHEMETMDDALKPEHIICTGDIVWHGKSKEYKEALEWFQRLLKACHLTGKDISFCVGNHDIDLSCQFDDLDYNADMVTEIDELYQYENIQKLEVCLNAYNQFCREIGTIPYTYPSDGKRKYSYSVGYKDIPFSDGKTIRIMAMNTALLMTQKKIPDDKMWLGREQIKSLIQYGIIPAGEDIWYTIGLFHHSERFLHPNETSTYDGRSATLPSLMGYANLLACGHTESSGRPRLSKQPGGGTMLLGGAAYYNDQHINSFSMIYISDKKKSMGYIPYIYEGEWKDYDFCSQDYNSEYEAILEKPGEIYENTDFVIESESEQYVIPFKYLEFKNKGEQIDNHMDLMNHFRLEYDSKNSDEVAISCPEEKKSYAKTLSAYHDFMEFMKRCSGNELKIHLRNQQGDLLMDFQGISYEQVSDFDENFMKDILFIEEYYDVTFSLPHKVDKKEYDKITILKNIAMNGFTDKVKVLKSFRLKKSYEEMLHLYESALVHNEFGVYGEEFFSIRLFNVNVMLCKVLLCAGPFRLDLDDTKYKLDTYQKYDERYCYFYSDKQVNTYIIKDPNIIKKESEQPSFTLIDDYGELGFSLDL